MNNLFPSGLTGMLKIDFNDFKKLIFDLHRSKTHFPSIFDFFWDEIIYVKNIVTVLQ